MTQPSQEVPAPVVVVGQRVREVREKRGRMSAQRLAEEMTKVGVPWNRDIVANLENGRRGVLSVHELFALAYVLDVAPVHLLFPIDDDQAAYTILPGRGLQVGTAREWVRGHYALPSTDERLYFSEVPRDEWVAPVPTAAQERRAILEDLERRGLGDLQLEDDEGGGDG